jgi:predicted nucleic acid-binding Zn ribbon protein
MIIKKAGNMTNHVQQNRNVDLLNTKFCGEKINIDAVVCVECGRQVEELKRSNNRQNNDIDWVAFILCLFLGVFGRINFTEDNMV